ncbi:dipeptidase PepV [Halobacillus massiliensis]|uniref:dipeptidase PepV n=1 Tax=Halobacillus massiliensis TaxID=1926286 RepID=UPI0009E28752|nr:dipeptidase PepV [Halobacillus massiliensis]
MNISLGPVEEQKYVQRLCELLKIESVYEESDRYPYGQNIDKALNYMLEMGEKDGFQVKNVDGHAGHIEFGEGEEILGILGHLDVVPPGDGWESPPFDPLVINGKIIARGAQDDKGPVMAAYLAMKYLKDQGFIPRKKVRLILGTDEERDWQGIDYYFKKEKMPAFGFTPDASFPVIHAEKGLIDGYIEYKLSEEQNVIEYIQGGERLNMVPAAAEAMLSNDPDNLNEKFRDFLAENNLTGEIKTEGKKVKVKITGKTAHASTPEKGKNAVSSLLYFLSRLQLPETSFLESLYRGLSKTAGEGMDLAVSDMPSGPLTINLGSLDWKKGQFCKIGINIRYPVTLSYQTVKEKLDAFAEKDRGQFKLYEHLGALYVEKDEENIQKLIHVYNKWTKEHASPESMGGATYARALKSGVAFGALFKDSEDTAHQANEYVLVSDMMKAAHIYADAIYQLTSV